MEQLMEGTITNPSYNGYVGLELDDVSDALDQYWTRRKDSCSNDVKRLELLTTDADAERVWLDFTRYLTGFLKVFLRDGAEASEEAFRSQLRWTKGLARDARALFLKDARAEIWIPFQHSPLRVVRAPGREGEYDIVDYPNYDGRELELGKAVVTVSWRGLDLFMLLPSSEYVSLDTFVVEKEGATWNTQMALPSSFAAKLAEVRSSLQDAEVSFGRLRAAWNAGQALSLARARLDGIDRAASLWDAVHIPAHQKLELLRRAEQFERNEPGAPSGLLLKGPSGTGKTLIARTLAETLHCHHQLLSLPDFKSPNLGESAQRVRRTWELARTHQPSIMFLDDCEGILAQRGAHETDKIEEEIVQAFLPEWDGVKGHSRIWMIGATNRPDMLDGATISRFGWEMDIPLPEKENRQQIFMQEVRSLGIASSIPTNIGELTQGMSGRDLHHLAASVLSLSDDQEPSLAQFMDAIAASRKTRSTSIDGHATWDTLVLDDTLMERFKVISTLLKEPEKWRSLGVSIPKTLLIVGAAGVGKTRAAITLARESGLNFQAPSMAQVKAAVLGGSANRVEQLFQRALSMAPSIVVLDKLEAIAPRRTSHDSKDPLTDEIAAQLEHHMSGVQARDGEVFLIATTHDPELVDEGVLSIFQERLYLPSPSRELRQRLLTNFLAGKKLAFSLEHGSLLLAELTEETQVSGGALEHWVQTAEQRALMRAIRNGGPEHLRIELEDFDSLPS